MDPGILTTGQEAFYTIVKIGLIIFLFLYVVFAAIVIKQARLMTETLEVGFELQIKFIVFLHLIVSVATLILAFILL